MKLAYAKKTNDVPYSRIKKHGVYVNGMYRVDCNSKPTCPEGLEIYQHNPSGIFNFTSRRLSLFQAKGQESGIVKGVDMEKELADQKVLPANILDFLLKHKHLIPSEWKGNNVLFFGTRYIDEQGAICVRFLYFVNSWHGGYIRILDNYLESKDLAVVDNFKKENKKEKKK